MRDYDVVVIGAGVAGLTAALTAVRQGLATVVIESIAPGGQIMSARRIENWPGTSAPVSGADLASLMFEQAMQQGAEVILDTVGRLDIGADSHVVLGLEDRYRAPAIIIAAGSRRRALGLDGEARLLGRGVSHCASCDGPLYRGKTVAVIGGGDTALDEAICLAEVAARVLVFHRGLRLAGQEVLIREACAIPNIEVRLDTVISEIVGEAKVEAVLARHQASGGIERVAVDAVFPCIGLEPNTEFLRGVIELGVSHHIVTDTMMRTSVAGIYAAGDIRDGSVALLTAAAGDGATAAISAWRRSRSRS